MSAEADPEGLRSTASRPDAARHIIDAVHEFFQGAPGAPGSLGDVLGFQESPPQGPRAKADLSKGEAWGPLIVLEWIDGGSFGDVFRAWDPTLAKEVALKRSRYSSASDAARAVLEAQRLADIPPHPNVITVYGARRVSGVVGIWMELLRGRTLQHVVKDEGALGWVEASHYGDCLCRALSHVHGAQVLHRDVKAANVMKAAGGRIVLIDFGAGEEIAPRRCASPGPPCGHAAVHGAGTVRRQAGDAANRHLQSRRAVVQPRDGQVSGDSAHARGFRGRASRPAGGRCCRTCERTCRCRSCGWWSDAIDPNSSAALQDRRRILACVGATSSACADAQDLGGQSGRHALCGRS